MLTIYGSNLSSPANKVRFVANYLKLPYEYHQVDLRAAEQKQEWFLKINPVGKVPAINDGGFCLFESNAIIKYLCDKVDTSLYPKDIQQRAIVEQWCDFVTLHIGVNVAKVVFNRVFAKRRGLLVSEESIADGLNFITINTSVIEHQLSKHAYVAGDKITLADMALLASLDPCEVAEIDISVFPKVVAWRNKLKQESFYTACHKEYGEMLKVPQPK